MSFEAGAWTHYYEDERTASMTARQMMLIFWKAVTYAEGCRVSATIMDWIRR